MTIIHNVLVFTFYVLLFLTMASPVFHLLSVLFTPQKKKIFTTNKPEQGMSILIPCYNEQSILQTTIEGLKGVNYKNYEIIFINDGSQDSTLEALKILLDLRPSLIKYDGGLDHATVRGFYKSVRFSNIFVIDKENGGKADCLNSAIVYAKHDLVVTLDADTILERNALRAINNKFQEKTIAGGGNVRILQGFNGSDKFSFNLKHIVRFQIIEYMKGFGILKQSLANVNSLIVISGAFGIFNRRILLGLGGWRKTVGEDIDITLRFQDYISKNPEYKMIYIPEAICYTECPENWRDLYNQRIRWQKAFIDCIVLYRASLIKTVFSKPVSFFVVVDALIVGTLTSYVATGFIILMLFFPIHLMSIILIAYSLFINMLSSISAIIISHKAGQRYGSKDVFRIITTIMFELLIFNAIRSAYIMLGTVLYFTSNHKWNKVARTGTAYSIEEQQPKVVDL